MISSLHFFELVYFFIFNYLFSSQTAFPPRRKNPENLLKGSHEHTLRRENNPKLPIPVFINL